ncbi:MAG: hypothetical protein SFW62_02060 [Alphaproteobacteria bacterium]|nr:hypothetical protein [Alphaproteobacteria bacterium]
MSGFFDNPQKRVEGIFSQQEEKRFPGLHDRLREFEKEKWEEPSRPAGALQETEAPALTHR